MRLAPLALCLAACTASSTPAERLQSLLDELDEPAPLREPPPPPAESRLRDGPNTPPTPLQQVASVAADRSIGAADDEVHWLGRNARFAVLARPTLDGPRCEPFRTRARRTLHDLVDGTSEPINRIVAHDPRGRYLVVHAGAHLWLLDGDTGTRSDLAARGAGPADAGDPCAATRRADFDSAGRHLVYLRGPQGREQVLWRDLASGRELTVQVPASAGPIWRAEPSVAPGWVRIFSVPLDSNADGKRRIPHNRFVARGDEVVSLTLHVGDDARPIVGPGGLSDAGFSAIDDGLFTAMFHRRPPLLATTGSAPAVPPGCENHTLLDGLSAVLLECDAEARLWWPRTQHTLSLPAGAIIDAPTHLDDDGHLWRAARSQRGPDEIHIVRVDTDSAIATAGPRVLLDVVESGQEPIATDRAGWMYFNNPAGLLALHVASGETRVHPGVIARRLRPGAAELHGRWYALDPARGRMHALTRAPAAVAENGCALVGAGKLGREGPYTRHCPQP